MRLITLILLLIPTVPTDVTVELRGFRPPPKGISQAAEGVQTIGDVNLGC